MPGFKGPSLVGQVSSDAGESWALDTQTTALTPWGPSRLYKIPAGSYVVAPNLVTVILAGALVCPGGAQNGGEERRHPPPPPCLCTHLSVSGVATRGLFTAPEAQPSSTDALPAPEHHVLGGPARPGACGGRFGGTVGACHVVGHSGPAPFPVVQSVVGGSAEEGRRSSVGARGRRSGGDRVRSHWERWLGDRRTLATGERDVRALHAV